MNTILQSANGISEVLVDLNELLLKNKGRARVEMGLISLKGHLVQLLDFGGKGY